MDIRCSAVEQSEACTAKGVAHEGAQALGKMSSAPPRAYARARKQTHHSSKTALTAATLCGPQLSHTRIFLRPLALAHGPMTRSTHMHMPTLSIHALCCVVMTVLSTCTRYGRK